MTEQQEQYTEIEKEAQKWLNETDTMQFSQMELLTMFAGKKVKDYDLLHNVSNRFSDPKFIDNVCLSYRHDFGLLSEDEQNKVRFECKEWMRAIKNNERY